MSTPAPNFIQAILNLERQAQALGEFEGKVPAIALGTVTDTADPLGWHRVKASLPGGETDWLWACYPPGLSLPIPPIGATVVIAFVGGNPHTGVVLGVLVNQRNPPAGDGLAVLTQDASIADRQIATVGAKDTRNDTLVTPGRP